MSVWGVKHLFLKTIPRVIQFVEEMLHTFILFVSVLQLANGQDAKIVDVASLRIRSSSPFLVADSGTHTLTCLLTISTALPPTSVDGITWSRDGAQVGTGEVYMIDTSSLEVDQFEGEYSCSGELRVDLPVDEEEGSGEKAHVLRQQSAPFSLRLARTPPFMERSQALRRWPGKVVGVEGERLFIPCPYDLSTPVPSQPTVHFERVSMDSSDTRRRRVRRGRRRHRALTDLTKIDVSDEHVFITDDGLLIENATQDDVGKYRCVLTNTITHMTQRQKGWTKVNMSPPKMSNQRRLIHPVVREHKRNVAVGQSITLPCVASDGPIIWRRTSIDIAVTTEHNMAVITNATTADSDTYTCTVGDDEAIYHVRVIAPTTTELQVRATEDRQGVRVTCSSSSRASLYVDRRPLRDSLDVLPIRHASLMANPIMIELNARQLALSLQCLGDSMYNTTGVAQAATMHGDAHSVYLQMSPPPMPFAEETVAIRTAPENTTATVGDTVTLVCIVSAHALSVHWQRNGVALTLPSSRARLVGSGTLEMMNVTNEESGWYTCVASGLHEENATAQAYLNVGKNGAFGGFAIPPRPTMTSSTSTTESTTSPSTTTTTTTTTTVTQSEMPAPIVYASGTIVNVHWDNPSNVDTITIEYMAKGGDNWNDVELFIPRETTNARVLTFNAGHSYAFRMSFELLDGTVRTSEHSSFVTLREPIIADDYDEAADDYSGFDVIRPPTFAPDLMHVRALSPDALEMEWTYSDDEEGVRVDGFVVQYMLLVDGFNGDEAFNNLTVLGGMQRTHTVDYLLPNTAYKLRVMAYNSEGAGPASNIIVGYTDDQGKSTKTTPTTPSPTVIVFSTNSSGPFSFMSEFAREFGVEYNDEYAVLTVVAGSLLLLIIMLVCCMCACLCRQRREDKINHLAAGRFEDTAQRMYKEQRSDELKGRGTGHSYTDAYVSMHQGMTEHDPMLTPALPDKHTAYYAIPRSTTVDGSQYDLVNGPTAVSMYAYPTTMDDPLPPPIPPPCNEREMLSAGSAGTRHTFLSPGNASGSSRGSPQSDDTPMTPSRVSTFKPPNLSTSQ